MSHRITKDEARMLSHRLVSVKNDGVEALREAYKKKALELYNATVPKDILACFKKHPTWFSVSESIKVDSFGFNREWISTPDDVEVIQQGDESELKLTRETASELLATKRAWEKERDKVEKTRNEIKNALINLHTYKRIIEQFPEAEPHLPKKYSPPAVNYSQLKPVVKELVQKLEETKRQAIVVNE